MSSATQQDTRLMKATEPTDESGRYDDAITVLNTNLNNIKVFIDQLEEVLIYRDDAERTQSPERQQPVTVDDELREMADEAQGCANRLEVLLGLANRYFSELKAFRE